VLCVGKELGGIFGRGRADGGVGVGVGSSDFSLGDTSSFRANDP
jgi:hypothetical protein